MPRATATVNFTIGLANIPISLYKGTDEGGLKGSLFTKAPDEDGEVTYHKVKMKRVDEVTGEEVEYSDIVHLYETPQGPVELSNEEKDAIVKAQGGTGEIVAFVPVSQMAAGRYVPDGMYQARPKKDDPTATKFYDAMLRAMRKEGVFALVKYVLKSGSMPKFGAIMPNGRLYTLIFDTYVREELPLPAEVADDSLVEKFRALLQDYREEDVEIVDDATSELLEYGLRKLEGDAPTLAQVSGPDTTTEQDLEAILEASLRNAASA